MPSPACCTGCVLTFACTPACSCQFWVCHIPWLDILAYSFFELAFACCFGLAACPRMHAVTACLPACLWCMPSHPLGPTALPHMLRSLPAQQQQCAAVTRCAPHLTLPGRLRLAWPHTARAALCKARQCVGSAGSAHAAHAAAGAWPERRGMLAGQRWRAVQQAGRQCSRQCSMLHGSSHIHAA